MSSLQPHLPRGLLTPQTPPSPLHSTLLTDAALLHLLHHRNKNQHRRSLWYRALQSFLRELRRLLAALALPDRASASARLAFWAATPLLAHWHTSFTQLVASTQFAALGLALLGVLARVCRVTGLAAFLVRRASEQGRVRAEREEREVREVLERFAGEVQLEGADLGVVVERNVGRGEGEGGVGGVQAGGSEVVAKLEVRGEDARGGESVGRKRKVVEAGGVSMENGAKAKRKTKKKRKEVNAIDALFAGL